jgi:prepilin-type N-terminal cleavage/methylation domain-containing protein
MMKGERGFTLLELLMVMIIFGFVLAATSDMFVGILRGYKQQSKIAETNIEGIIGLELLRRDIDHAGYGLPWMMSGATYSEATDANSLAYNDSSSNPPRAILSGIDASGRAYLVIKAMNVARNDTCAKWTHLLSSGGTPTTTIWEPPTANANLNSSDRVIVISPGTPVTNSRALVAPTSFPSTLQFSGVTTYTSSDETRIIYGVDPPAATPLRMPFNRADYYVSTPADLPGRCAQGTGVLYKAIVSQKDGSFPTENILPLLDCVADMQVITYLDTNGDGEVDDKRSVLLGGTDAKMIREQLKEVRVYILAHEGQRDTTYTHPTNPILVGESATLGRNFDFTTATIPNWQNYRWKVYSLVVKPNNLR